MSPDELECRLAELSDPAGHDVVAAADDVRRGQRALRRRRMVQVGAAAAAVAVVATGTTLLLDRDSEPTPVLAKEALSWEMLQRGAPNPVFPGSPPLKSELDANSVPLLHQVIDDLDPDGDHIGPPAMGGSSWLRKGVPATVPVIFDWDGAGTVAFTLARSMSFARSVADPCLGKCPERKVDGRAVVVAGEPGLQKWLVAQDDGEVVVVDPQAMPDGLSIERLLDATDDLDLPAKDLTPKEPTDPMRATAEQIWRDHVSGSRLTDRDYFASYAGNGPEWRDGKVVNTEFVSGEASGMLGGVDHVRWGYTALSTINAEDDSSCDPEDFTTCDDRVIGGQKVHLMWEYAAQGAGVVVRHDGEIKRVEVRVPYDGQAGVGTPAVPLTDLAALVTDERWQQ